MTFGTPAIGKAPSSRKGGRPAHLYDCGRYGKLPLASIAKLAGITKCGAAVRVRRGLRGEALVENTDDVLRRGWRRSGCNSWVMVTATKLARAFPEKLPTTREIRAVVPMSEQSASRWRSALRDAALHLETFAVQPAANENR